MYSLNSRSKLRICLQFKLIKMVSDWKYKYEMETLVWCSFWEHWILIEMFVHYYEYNLTMCFVYSQAFALAIIYFYLINAYYVLLSKIAAEMDFCGLFSKSWNNNVWQIKIIQTYPDCNLSVQKIYLYNFTLPGFSILTSEIALQFDFFVGFTFLSF